MIELNGQTYSLSEPIVLASLLALVVVVVILVLLISTMRRAGRSADMAQAMAAQVGGVNARVQQLSDGQHQMFGGLNSVSEAQAQQQAQMIKLMEQRLAQVTEAMNVNLQSSARNTAQSLGELQQRLKTIDKAQENITRLSGDVLSLQDILSNKQTRGAFGEIQLNDIVSKALPADSYSLQATLSNGKRADCLIHLPNPPGPIVVDSKFPLEPYEAMLSSQTQGELKAAIQLFKSAVRKHIKDISEKYILEGETADGALMFLPSEAIYAELHSKFSDLVQEGFQARVWIVSPTTCMATLNTMRAILKDARMREQAGAIRKELAMLSGDVERLGTRVGNLDRHFSQASKDIEEIKISADKAGKRARRLDNFDFEEIEADGSAKVVPLSK